MRYAFFLLALAAPVVAQEPVVAIRNANVETMTPAGRIEAANVIIRNGKIEAVGKDAKIPDDARVIDAAGGTVMPGIIEPHFEVAVAAANADTGPRTIVFRGQVITLPPAQAQRTTFTRIADNFYPYDAGFKLLPRAGFTHLNLLAAGTGLSAGIRVTPADPERMLSQPNGLAFVSVSNSTEGLDSLRQRLDAVAQRAELLAQAAQSGVLPPNLAPTALTKLWDDIVDGKAPILINVANAATVPHVLNVMEKYKKLRPVIVLGSDAVAESVDALKGRKIPVIVRPAIDLAPATRDRILAAKILHQAGIEFAYTLAPASVSAAANLAAQLGGAASESAPNVADLDFPLFAVAMQVKGGLPRQVALEALTKRPAAILGLGETHGTVAPGKAADLLLYSGDPLDPASRLRLTLIEGRTVYEN